jgi:hypothetical protein
LPPFFKAAGAFPPVEATEKSEGRIMSRGLRGQLPALVLAGLALVAALSGTVYAAAKINGKTIKVKSLPGNRLAIGSVPGNRLKPGAIRGAQLAPGSVTGAQIDSSTLGLVPLAAQARTAEQAQTAQTAERAQSAQTAERAQSAQTAETALHAGTAQSAVSAQSAEDAKAVGGYEAGCKPGTQSFAGACWQSDPNASALNAPAAAAFCAQQGGELPDALSLAAFSQQPGNTLADGGEWSSDIPVVSSENVYAVVTVTPEGKVSSAVSSTTKKFRCVVPLLS